MSDNGAAAAAAENEATQELEETAARQAWELELLRESVQRLEQALMAPGWRQLAMQGRDEFSRSGLRTITELARLMRVKNPQVFRGVDILRLYVWAQGIQVRARDQEVNAVIQAFLDDERNRVEVGSHQARGQREVDLETEGNLFFRFFVNPQTGRVRVRTVPFDEIDDVICNPQDAKEPYFYKRTWIEQRLDGTPVQRTEYYPDFRYMPVSRTAVERQLPEVFSQAAGAKVVWDTPVYHVKINLLQATSAFGISRLYPALDWSLAYKNFLEQLASVWAALARWAAKLTVTGGARGVAAAKTALGTTLGASTGESNPSPLAGSTFLQAEGNDLQPFRTAGATMSAEDGRRLLLMSIMTFGFPETFFGDVSVGTLATAKSLDRPSELRVIDRQALWKDVYGAIFGFVLLQAVKAPAGPLQSVGRLERERDGDEYSERVTWNSGVDATVTVEFPPIREENVQELVGAITTATTLNGGSPAGALPVETAVAQFLRVLGIQDTDEVMALWKEEQAVRQARADEMAQRMGQGSQGGDDAADQGDDAQRVQPEDTGEAYRRMMAAVGELLETLREAPGAA